MFLLTLFSCSKDIDYLSGEFTTDIVDTDVYSRYTSLFVFDDSISVYYSDEMTLSIKSAYKSDENWIHQYIDRVDISERINPGMGKHFVIFNEKENLFYIDYQREQKRVFKYLARRSADERYVLEDLGVDCSDFYFVNDNSGLFFYLSDRIRSAKFDYASGKIIDMAFESDEISDIVNFAVYSTLDYITMIYTDTAQKLYVVRMKEDDNSIVIESKKLIASDVSLFDPVFSGVDAGVIYYDNKYLVSYYEAGVVTKIGYYPYVTQVHAGVIDGKNFFVISSVNGEPESSEKYNLYFIYRNSNKKNKWQEAKIIDSEVPFTAVNSVVKDNYIYLLSSGVHLTLNIIPGDKL